uniref:Uncharacterized protein n=1 Tax=Arundo donax TaxID=35708 RepID=A0A0A9A2M1_ARUDO
MSDPLQMHCFLALSIFSITLTGSLIEHMAYVGMEEMTELTFIFFLPSSIPHHLFEIVILILSLERSS